MSKRTGTPPAACPRGCVDTDGCGCEWNAKHESASVFQYARSWFAIGRDFGRVKERGWWLLAGPLVVEAHPWLRLGVCVGRWYVGCYLGPFVITLGLRRWQESCVTWSTLKITTGQAQDA